MLACKWREGRKPDRKVEGERRPCLPFVNIHQGLDRWRLVAADPSRDLERERLQHSIHLIDKCLVSHVVVSEGFLWTCRRLVESACND